MKFGVRVSQAYLVVLWNWRWIAVYWIGVIVLGTMAFSPVARSLDRYFHHRAAAAELYPGPRAQYFFEWLRETSATPVVSTVGVLLVIAIGLIWMLHLVISTGWLHFCLSDGFGYFRVTEGLRRGSLYVRHQLIALPLWLILWGLILIPPAAGVRLWLQYARSHHLDAWLSTTYGGILLGSIAAVFLAGLHWDLTRISAFEPRPFWAAFRGLRRLMMRPLATLAVWMFYTGLSAGIVWALAQGHRWWMSHAELGAASWGWITYLAGIWVRIWNRFAYYNHLCEVHTVSVARPEGLEPPTL